MQIGTHPMLCIYNQIHNTKWELFYFKYERIILNVFKGNLIHIHMYVFAGNKLHLSQPSGSC